MSTLYVYPFVLLDGSETWEHPDILDTFNLIMMIKFFDAKIFFNNSNTNVPASHPMSASQLLI